MMRFAIYASEWAATVACALSLPLFLDLALALVGNAVAKLRRPSIRSSAARLSPPCDGQLAIIIPAHNEQQMIAHTVGSVAASVANSRHAPRHAPILVVAHNCSDATAAAARAAGATVLELRDDARHGKSSALRAGFAAARAMGCTAFAVVDADSTVTPNFIDAIESALASGAHALQCRYEQESSDPASAAQRLRLLAFRGMNVVRPRGRAALGCSCGIFGNGFALTAALLDRVPFAANSIAEDAEYHAALVAHGVPVHWIDHARVTAPLASTHAAHESQQARWEGGRLRVGLRVAPALLAAILRGSLRSLEALRAAEALLAALSLPFSLAVALALLCLALPTHWSRIYGLVCLLITALYLAAAAQAGAEPAKDWRALAAAPAFALRKLLLLPTILTHAHRRAPWVRTARETNHHDR